MSDPTRQACPGSKRTTSDCSHGGKVKAYKNVSTMKDEVGAYVAPFVRFGPYTDICGQDGPTQCRLPGQSTGGSHCYSVLSDGIVRSNWPPDTESLPDYDPATDPILVKSGNTFQATETDKPYGCKDFGFKSVDGIKNWHGAFPFTHDLNGIDCQHPWKFWDTTLTPPGYSVGPHVRDLKDWNNAQSYGIGAVVTYDSRAFKSLVSNNSSTPGTDATKWLLGVRNLSNVKYLKRTYNIEEARFWKGFDFVQVAEGGLPSGRYYTAEFDFTASNIVRSVNKNTGEITANDSVSRRIRKRSFNINALQGEQYPPYSYSLEEIFDDNTPSDVTQQCNESIEPHPDVTGVHDDLAAQLRCLGNLPMLFTGLITPIGFFDDFAGSFADNVGSLAGYAQYLYFMGNPSDGQSVSIGGITYTFKNEATGGNEVQIGSILEETRQNFFNTVAASNHPSITVDAENKSITAKPGVGPVALSPYREPGIGYNSEELYPFWLSPYLPPYFDYSGFTWTGEVTSTETIEGDFWPRYNTADISVTVSRSGNVYSWDCTIETYSKFPPHYNIGNYPLWRSGRRLKGSVVLSDPYHIDDVLKDAAELAAEWKLEDKKNDEPASSWRPPRYLEHPWRTDEHLYEAVEVYRDENWATSPEIDFRTCPVDDYTNPLSDGEHEPFANGWSPTWGKRPWFDTYTKAWLYNPPYSQAQANEMRDRPDGGLISTGHGTGEIFGKPLPYGYGVSVGGSPRGSFDHFFDMWERRYCPYSQTFSCRERTVSRGMWTPSYIPENAQRWTRHSAWPQYDFVNYGQVFQHPNRIYPCSFVKADQFGIHLRKMVQTIVPKPAYDWTRPHTADRYLLDQPAYPLSLNKIYYVASVTGSVVTLKNRDGTAPSSVSSDFAVNDLILIPKKNSAGGTLAITAGVYPVTAVSGATVTVGTIVRQIPTGFTNDSRDADQAFGKIRFKDAPGFSGRLAVTATAADGNTLLTYANSPYIQTGDLVDLWDGSSWDSNGGAGYALTRLTDTTATISGAHLNTTHIVPHAYAVIDPETNAPLSGQKWWFCGIEQTYKNKGDYVIRHWTMDIGLGALEWVYNVISPKTEAIQRCLPIGIPCSAKVAGHSPQYQGSSGTNETSSEFINAKIEPHPTTIDNGVQWLGAVEQHMIDPLWQVPHKPGAGQFVWTMDNGSCLEDTQIGQVNYVYYRMPDYYESRISVPGGYGTNNDQTAPGLPDGVEALDAYQPPPDNGIITKPCSSPGDGYAFKDAMPTVSTPWSIYYRQQNCVCNKKRFYEQYKANGVTC